MKIRLDDVMQSLSYPFQAVYYYYIPLETVLMFMGGRIYGKAVYGISTEEDLLKRSGEYTRDRRFDEVIGPEMGELVDYARLHDDLELKDLDEDERMLYFENAVRERHLLIKWFNYRDEVYMEFSKRWCSENGLELIE